MNKLAMLVDRHDIEDSAWEQIEAAQSHLWLKALAIMPDVHAGYDLPIGAVALTEGVISPSFVGFDIGCGMCSVDTGLTPAMLGIDTPERRQWAFQSIKREVPMGLGCVNDSKASRPPVLESRFAWLSKAVNDIAPYQLGTLGGGNHFIEVGILSTTGTVCVTIHSGSRKAGHQICEFYLGFCSLFTDKPTAEKSYLSLDSEVGQAYLADMAWAQEYALLNRLTMMRRVLDALGINAGAAEEAIAETLINENHNHAELQAGGTVLHRKGATPAALGQAGVIPGDMAKGVYITVGLGNGEFLCSASHGAGRAMSRGQAKRTITPESFASAMEGITADTDNRFLDEAPGAYKDLEWVISKQRGVVVDIVAHAAPIINVKG